MARTTILALIACFGLQGCGGGAECELDTDCQLFQQCSDGTCVTIASNRRDGGRDAGRDAGGDSAVPERKSGSVVIFQNPAAPEYRLSAAFGREGNPNCSSMTVESCNVRRCTPAPPPPDGGLPTPHYPDAGAITVTGGAAEPTIMPNGNGIYPTLVEAAVLWNVDPAMPRPELRIQAAGGMLAGTGEDPGPFTIRVEGPANVTFTGPDLSMPQPKAQPLVFTWEPALTSALRVTLVTGGGDAERVEVSCVFSEGATGAVPAAALAMMPGTTANYSAYTFNSASRPSGVFDVTGQARTVVAGGSVTWQ